MIDAQYLLKAPTPSGTFIFSEPSEDDWLLLFGDKVKEKEFTIENIMARLVGLEGIKDRAGKELTVEEFKEQRGSLGRSVTVHMRTSFWTAWTKAMSIEGDAKNEKAPTGT
jgi:hypothetical protein